MTPTRKIVFDGRYIQDRYHGIGRYAFHLLNELACLIPDLDWTVLRDPSMPDSRFSWKQIEDNPRVKVQTVNAPLFSAREQMALARALLASRAAVYHSPYFAMPWAVPNKGMVTVHDCIFERDPRYMPKSWARGYYRLLMQWSLARSRFVFVPSHATARDVRKYYRVQSGKLVVTPEAADSNFRLEQDLSLLARTRQRYNLPDKFVLAVGARRPHKNFDTLVKAMSGVSSAALVFVGEADERFPDTAGSLAAGLGDRVRFLGKVSEEDLPLVYNLAAAFACPSLVEGFGLPVLEAMASGAPVVASDIPSLKEVAGDAALFVPATDYRAWASILDALVTDDSRLAELRQAGIARASQFTWRRTAEAAAPAYGKLGLLNPPIQA